MTRPFLICTLETPPRSVHRAPPPRFRKGHGRQHRRRKTGKPAWRTFQCLALGRMPIEPVRPIRYGRSAATGQSLLQDSPLSAAVIFGFDTKNAANARHGWCSSMPKPVNSAKSSCFGLSQKPGFPTDYRPHRTPPASSGRTSSDRSSEGAPCMPALVALTSSLASLPARFQSSKPPQHSLAVPSRRQRRPKTFGTRRVAIEISGFPETPKSESAQNGGARHFLPPPRSRLAVP